MTRLLYVEDNDDNVYMLSRRLKRKGYEVVVARSGQEALQIVATEAPALILMDLSIPIVDGWEVTRRLKADPASRHIPIIALSAHVLAEARERALAAGCDDFDTKPVEFARLLAKIESWLPGERS